MRISLTQTILLSTALLTMNLPLVAMEETDTSKLTSNPICSQETNTLQDILSPQSALFTALGLPTTPESTQTIITKTIELLNLKEIADLNKMYEDYLTLTSALPTETNSGQKITALLSVTQIKPCDYNNWFVNDQEENAANESVINDIYPLTSPDSANTLNLRANRLASLNATYEAILNRELQIHKQNENKLATENRNTTNRLNSEYGERIEKIKMTIAIQEKSVEPTSIKSTTPQLDEALKSLLSELKGRQTTEEENLTHALKNENERFTSVSTEEKTRFEEKLQNERKKFESRLFDYAYTRQTISKLRAIMQAFENLKNGVDKGESVRELDETQLNVRKNAEINIADIKEKIIGIESIEKAMYPFSRSTYKTITNKPFLGIGTLLGQPTHTQLMRKEATGIDTLPPQKIVSVDFTCNESLDLTVNTLMQNYVSVIVTKSAALPNALTKGYISYISAENASTETANSATEKKLSANTQAESKIDYESKADNSRIENTTLDATPNVVLTANSTDNRAELESSNLTNGAQKKEKKPHAERKARQNTGKNAATDMTAITGTITTIDGGTITLMANHGLTLNGTITMPSPNNRTLNTGGGKPTFSDIVSK